MIPKRKKRRHWKAEEEALLKQWWLDGVLVPEIAARLDRSEGAVHGKANVLGLPSRHNTRVGKQVPMTLLIAEDKYCVVRRLAMREGKTIRCFMEQQLDKIFEGVW